MLKIVSSNWRKISSKICTTHLCPHALGVLLVTHMVPVDIADERLQGMINLTRNLLQNDYPALNAHEVRIVSSKSKPIFVFDLEIPYESKKKAIALRDSIINDIKKATHEYDCAINIEYGYTD